MNKSKQLFLISSIFLILYLLVFFKIINLYTHFSISISQSIYSFLCSGFIISGYISAYINNARSKKLSIIFFVLSSMALLQYIFSALLGSIG